MKLEENNNLTIDSEEVEILIAALGNHTFKNDDMKVTGLLSKVIKLKDDILFFEDLEETIEEAIE